MNILIVCTARGGGGVWRHVADLALGLRARGHEVAVSLHPDAEELIRRAALYRLPVVPLAESPSYRCDIWHLHLHKTIDREAMHLGVRRWVSRSRGSVVLTEHLPRAPASDPSMPSDPTLKPGRRKPGARLAKAVIKRAQYRSASAVVVVSQRSKEFIISRWGKHSTPIFVVPNGVPTVQPLPPHEGPRTPLRVAVIGALGWRKGHDVLIEATRLATCPWEVRCAGEGPIRDELDRLATTRAQQVVTFLGQVADVSELLAWAHVICLPSRAEASPYAVLEAMAHGRLVVASDVDGVSELLDSGRCGVLVAADDPLSLAQALDKCAGAWGDEVVQRAHERVVSEYGTDRMVERTLHVYQHATLKRPIGLCNQI